MILNLIKNGDILVNDSKIKPSYKVKCGDEITINNVKTDTKDITPWDYPLDIVYEDDDIIIVNKYYIARPDLISLAVYGSDEYADLICKYNGISNPFELNENDVIVLPQYHEFQNLIDTVNNTTSELVNDDVSDNTNYSSNKKKSDRRSPAQTTTGDKNFIIDKSLGVVFY